MKTLTILVALFALAGCASIKPSLQCGLDGKAHVMQGIAGIGVGQAIADADSICAPLVDARDQAEPSSSSSSAKKKGKGS